MGHPIGGIGYGNELLRFFASLRMTGCNGSQAAFASMRSSVAFAKQEEADHPAEGAHEADVGEDEG